MSQRTSVPSTLLLTSDPQWQAFFQNNSITYNYEAYLANPTINGTLYFQRNITSESEFFWKDAGIFPNPYVSAQDNIAALTVHYLAAAKCACLTSISAERVTSAGCRSIRRSARAARGV